LCVIRIDWAKLEQLPKREREEALELLAEMEQVAIRNPLERYRPASCHEVYEGGVLVSGHPEDVACTADCHHSPFHSEHAACKAFFGGNRAGKTTTVIVDDIIQACPDELLPEHLRPFKKWTCPFYCRVMTPDMERTMKPVIWEKLREWLPRDLLKGGSFDKSVDRASNSLRLECGCRFDFLSYEMSPDKFGGAALHRCHFDESPPKSIRTECLLRLVDYNGDEVYSLTPLKGLDFTYKNIWKKRRNQPDEAKRNPEIFAIQVGIYDNPLLSAVARDRVMAVVADDKDLAARRDGAFMSAEGAVYPEWESIVQPPPPQPSLYLQTMEAHVIAIDPGIRYAGFSFVSYDEENRSTTWRATKFENYVAEDYAREIKRGLAEHGLSLDSDDLHITIDPNAVARSIATGENILDELTKYDIYASPAQNDVETGVLQIRRRIRNDWAVIWDVPETEALRDELEELQVDVDQDKDDGQFRIVKTKDHTSDSWRYNHMERSWLPEIPESDDEPGIPWWEKATPPPRKVAPGSVMGAMA
jgi:phage terminase large subunit-like protein